MGVSISPSMKSKVCSEPNSWRIAAFIG
jgi:hypothetical protein